MSILLFYAHRRPGAAPLPSEVLTLVPKEQEGRESVLCFRRKHLNQEELVAVFRRTQFIRKDDSVVVGKLLRATLLIQVFPKKQEGRFAPKGGPNCLYDSGVDTRFSCPMVKRGRVSNNYEFEVKYNCSGLIKFPLIQELCFTQCRASRQLEPIGHSCCS